MKAASELRSILRKRIHKAQNTYSLTPRSPFGNQTISAAVEFDRLERLTALRPYFTAGLPLSGAIVFFEKSFASYGVWGVRP
jgi:hypothetical protein